MQTKFKGFEVTDFAALKAAFPKVVETVEAVKSADVRKLLELGVTVPGVTVTGENKVGDEAAQVGTGIVGSSVGSPVGELSNKLPEPAHETYTALDCVATEGGKASVEQVIPAFYNKVKKGE